MLGEANGFLAVESEDGNMIEQISEEVPDRQTKALRVEDFSDFPSIPRRSVLRVVPSGEIAIEQGADGIFLRFDCDCIHALPVCQAQCCALPGTVVFGNELQELDYPVEWDDSMNNFVLRRDSDGFCHCLDKDKRLCTIYKDRPHTCREFHCTRGADQRGWKIPNSVCRQSR